MKKKYFKGFTRVVLIFYGIGITVLPYSHLKLHRSHDSPGSFPSDKMEGSANSCSGEEHCQWQYYANCDAEHHSSHTSEECSLCKITQTSDGTLVLSPIGIICIGLTGLYINDRSEYLRPSYLSGSSRGPPPSLS